jgi:creatinine amidohydrolase
MADFLTPSTSADAAAQAATVAVLPVGSFEQHGDFLPLATDTMIACLIAQRIAADHDLLLLPPITISCSHEHAAFPGTVSISATTLAAIIGDIQQSLRTRGISKLVLVNAHGGNYVLSNVVQEANVTGPNMTLFPARDDWDRARSDAGCDTTTSQDMHAGELEVSLLLHADASLVGDTRTSRDHLAYPRPHLLATGIAGYTQTGVIGLPSRGTAAKGKAILDSLSGSFAAHLGLLTGISSENASAD